MTRHK